MLSTNTVEDNGNIDDGITTKVSITHHPIHQKPISTGNRIPETRSPPYADATDTDENSDEYEDRIDKVDGRLPNISRTISCSNQLQKRYCSLQCYNAAESNTR